MNTGISLKLLFGSALLAATSIASSADWPQWRGPNRDGVSTESGLMQEWPKEGPPLAWKAKGLGGGYSTVSVVDGRVYTSGETGAVSSVVCINAADGKPLWAAKLGKAGAPGWGGFAGPRATPTYSDGKLYTVDQWGELVCHEAKSGKEVWRKSYTGDLGGKRPEWGFSESVLVDGDKVIATPGGPKGALVALNKNTGAVLWQSRDFTDPAHYSSVIIGEPGGRRQYIQLTAAHVCGITPDKGQVLWTAERSGKTAVIPTPIADGDYVYVTSGYGAGCNLFRVSGSDGKFAAEQVYAKKDIENHHGGVVKVGDYLYGHSEKSGWTCQEFRSGEVRWQEKQALRKGAILAVGKKLILRQEDQAGTIVLIDASPDGWKEHGRFDQPERSDKKSWAHPVVSGGMLYLRDQDLLLCYSLKGK